jgi:hypothetical protein
VRLRLSALALVSVLAAAAARAQDDAAAPQTPLQEMAPSHSAPGWSRQANSLLLYGQDGDLQQELPLRAADDAGAGTTSRETLGGVSPDGSLAWTLERRLTWSPGRTKVIESHRLFRLYGTTGGELWREESVDLPERGDPAVFSKDGKTLLLCERSGDGFIAEARTWMGQIIATLGSWPRLISMALSPNGRFALARGAVPDKSDTHSFIDLKTRVRRDVPSSDLVLGLARVGDDGVVRSGSKVVFAFDLNASSATAASPAAEPK